MVNLFNKGSFTRHVLTLFSGSAAARLVTIMLAPVITRLFDPSDFGIAALFIAVTAVLAPVAGLRYDQAIVLPKEKQDAHRLFALAFVILPIFCVVFSVLVVLAGVLFSDRLWVDKLGGWLYVLPVALLIAGSASIAVGANIREQGFATIAKADMSDAVITGLTRIGTGFLGGSSVSGLLLGTLAGMAARLKILLGTSPGYMQALGGSITDTNRLKSVATGYREFPLYSAPTGLLRALNQQLPVLLLPFLFGPAVIGYYALSARIVKMPVVVFSNAFRRVFLQRISVSINDRRPFGLFYTKVTVMLAVMSAILFPLILLFSGDVFAWVFGQNWRVAGEFTAVLSPWFLAMFVQAPSAAVFVALKKQAILMRINLVVTFVGVALFVVAGIATLSPLQTLTVFSLIGVLSNILVIVLGAGLVRAFGRQSRQGDLA
jgi:O-antigen/teichoic acid export membrane protein